MDQESKASLKSKQDIVALIDRSRLKIDHDLDALAEAANPATLLRRSVSEHPVAWSAGAAVAGIVGAKMLLSSRKDSEGKGKFRRLIFPVLGFALKAALPFAMPVAEKYIQNRLAEPQE